MRRWKVLYLTGKKLSTNTHQPTQLKKYASHKHYQNSTSLFPLFFGSPFGFAKCKPPTRPRLGLHCIIVTLLVIISVVTATVDTAVITSICSPCDQRNYCSHYRYGICYGYYSHCGCHSYSSRRIWLLRPLYRVVVATSAFVAVVAIVTIVLIVIFVVIVIIVAIIAVRAVIAAVIILVVICSSDGCYCCGHCGRFNYHGYDSHHDHCDRFCCCLTKVIIFVVAIETVLTITALDVVWLKCAK